MVKHRFYVWLTASVVLFFASTICLASAVIQSAAVSLNGFSNSVLQALCNLSLVGGIVVLLVATDRFKKNRNSPQQASFSGAVIYAVFGVGLIVLYFVV